MREGGGIHFVTLGPPTEEQTPADDAGRDAGRKEEPARRPGARLRWAELLQRVFREHVLACPFGGRRTVLAFVTERSAVKQILEHLGLPTTGPPVAPARSREVELDAWQDEVPTLQKSLR